MKELRVIVPEEDFQILTFKQEGLKGIAVINKNLKHFEPKEVFYWHCSILLEFQHLIEDEMPSVSERLKAEEFEAWLDKRIKEEHKDKPNALFLGRITWNGTRELIWRVHDAEKTNKLLNDLVIMDIHGMHFDYRIDDDKEWYLARWHLDNC